MHFKSTEPEKAHRAKQRASVMWIVQKANKNKVPAEYQDPYYRDHEGREHLKPGIVAQLANADLYCSALANIYGDPNFFSLSHWKVIQALARKGVYVAEPTDVALNETVLLQDSPIKMSAHLAVIEAMMALYIREVVVAERVVIALQEMSGGSHASPHDQEEALVLWVAKVTAALQERIAAQVTDENQQLPEFPRIQDLSDLSDGIGLAALISYYCPQELAWGDIAVADPPSMADSLYNIGLVIKFCHDSLPYNPCLLTKEDIVYMHSCVKQNVLAFVTELFFLLELQPVSCVAANIRRPSSKYASPSGMKPAGAPSVRRSHSMTLNDMTTEGGGSVGGGTGRARVPETRPHDQIGSSHSDYGGRESSMSDGPDGEFVVQRARGVSTLSDMIRSNKEAEAARQGGGGSADHNHDTHDAGSWYDARQRRIDDDTRSRISQEDDDSAIRMYRRDSQYGSIQDLQQTEKLPPAGMPSRFEHRPQGRSRSRRNSISAEESQLTVENFGGSQDNLNEYISRNTDKEAVAHVGRKDSSEKNHSRNSHPQTQIDNRVLDKLEREAIEREKREFMFGSKNAIFAEDPPSYDPPPPPPHQDSGSDSDRSSERDKLSKATSFAELSKIKEQLPSGGINIIYMQGDKEERKSSSKSNDKKTSFAALPNQTTWKQQITQGQSDGNKGVGDENMEPQIMASELHNVRLKLEEKRRNIEAEKRKVELMLSKQRQKMGKEAFMQAVVKGDIGAEVSQVSRRWLEGADQPSGAEVRTPDTDNMDYDQYQHSLTQMTDSLSEIQGDIQRLSSQQVQIQGLIRNGAPQQPQQPQQFYLHDQSPSSGGRRMWGDGGPAAPGDQFTSMSPATRRAQWGPVRPVPGQGGDYYQQGGGYYPPQPGYQQLPPLHQQPPLQGGGFMLHQAPYSLPAGAQQPSGNPMYQQQNGGQYYGAAQDHHYRGGYPPPSGHPQHHHQQQYPPPAQDGGRGGPAPFRLHSDGEDSSRGPSSLRSSAQSSPSRQPLQQHPYGHPYPPHYSPHYPHPQQQQQGYNNHLQHGQMNQQQNYHTSSSNLNGLQSTPGSRQSVSPSRGSKSEVGPTVIHAPVAAPPPDDMEPQNVSFIDADSNRASQEREKHSPSPQQHRTSLSSNRSRAGGGGGGVTSNNTSHLNNSGTEVGGDESPNTERLKRMSIGSGSRTYRITNDGTSPTRPTVGTKTFRVPTKRGIPLHDDADLPQPSPHQRSLSPPYRPDRDDPVTSNDDELLSDVKTEPLNDGAKPDKGFYITFDDDAPVKPKPQLRTKKFTRKSSTPTTPVSTPSKEDYPIVPDVPLRNSRFPSNASLDITPTYRRPSLFSPLSPTSPPAPYPGSSLRSPLSSNPRSLSSSSPRANGFSFAREEGGCVGDSTGESGGEELPLAEVAGESSTGLALLIGDELLNQEESALTDMERKKQKLMIMSMRRKQQQEEIRRAKELEAEQKREREKEEEDRKLRKKEEEKQRREIILERHKIKKAIEEAEKEGRYYQPPAWYVMDQAAAAASQQQSKASVRLRNKPSAGGPRPRPKTMIEGDVPDGERVLGGARRNRGSTQNIAGPPDSSIRKSTGRWGSSHSLSRAAGSRGSTNSLSGVYGSRSRLHEPAVETPNDYQVHAAARRPSMADNMTGSLLRRPSGYNSSGTLPNRGPGSANRRYRSTGNLSGASEHDSLVFGMSEDSGLGRATPPRRAPSPGMAGGARHLPSPSQPGSLPPGLITRRRPTLGGGFDDAASDISTTSSTMDFQGPRLYKQPASKSNRPIVLNAVEFCVFPGAVNQHNKQRVMEEIARSEAKHFLFLFRDTGCQFRGLYSYNVESEEVDKLHGTGPKRVTDNMFDKFFKYNSGAKSFSQVHTKHLTATIDAFTIHNSLWQGKRVSLPSKKDYALVI